MRRFVALISGDNVQLGLGELNALLDVLGGSLATERTHERLPEFTADLRAARDAAWRSAFVKESVLKLFEVGLEEFGRPFDPLVEDLPRPAGPIAVRALKLEEVPLGRTEVERWVAANLLERWRGLKVDLENPREVIRVFVTSRCAVGGLLVGVRDNEGIARRSPVNRPFRLPSTLKPKEARVVVNLARVPRGGTVFDPFAGSGAILLEASALGYEALGTEVKGWIARGARRNLKALGLGERSDVIAADARHLPLRRAPDGVATDPPYGKSTTVVGGRRSELVDEVIGELLDAMERGRRAVVVYPAGSDMPGILTSGRVVERYSYKVHSSLVRTVNVLVA
ncbi:MAG: RsmD family RNA methyltransferase [Aigarchaeota archaeon]|nr:RsmD family RNA methyltransferase [Candidatus Calditenuis fumarioli]